MSGRGAVEASGIALFDLADHRLTTRQPKSTGKVCDVPATRQLEERERVAVAFADDLVADGGIERSIHVVQQQRPGIAVAEPVDGQLGKPGEDLVAGAGPRCTHQRDPLGEQAAADESEDLCGSVVEPLRVVHDAEQWLLLGGVCEQRQRREPHQESVRRGTGALAEHRGEGLPLRDRQPVEVIQYGSAKLVEAAVGQLHLRLDPDGRHDVPTGDLLR